VCACGLIKRLEKRRCTGRAIFLIGLVDHDLLRFLRVEATRGAIQSDPDWRRHYLHLAMRRQRSIAKVAMARKLTLLLLASLRQ
jgi:hypothetical protein